MRTRIRRLCFCLAIGIVASILCVSCGEDRAENVSVSGWTEVMIDDIMLGDMKTIEYKGHEYVVFCSGYRFGMAHNPDCGCHGKTKPSNIDFDGIEHELDELKNLVQSLRQNHKEMEQNSRRMRELKDIGEKK